MYRDCSFFFFSFHVNMNDCSKNIWRNGINEGDKEEPTCVLSLAGLDREMRIKGQFACLLNQFANAA